MARTLDMERFQSKVAVIDGCHTWMGGRSKSGYGKFWAENETHRAHRWIYQQVFGTIPDGLQIDHTCNNRACVNISHLRVVSARENVLAGHSSAPARLNSEKTVCPRGHKLVTWNINESSKAKGERVCKACNLARSRSRYGDRPAGWWVEEADRLYYAYSEGR